MSEVTPATAPTASELRNRAARAKTAGTPGAKQNYRNSPAYKKAYADEMRTAGKAAAHERHVRDGVAAKIARADVAKKLAAQAEKAVG